MGYKKEFQNQPSEFSIFVLVNRNTWLGSFLIHGRFWQIIFLQNIQHAFYVLTWPDSSWLTSRVLSRSSLDWDRGRWNQMDLVIGTSFDIFTHILNAYCLFEICDHSINVMIIHLVVVLILVVGIMYNPKLAWANGNQLEKAPT